MSQANSHSVQELEAIKREKALLKQKLDECEGTMSEQLGQYKARINSMLG